MRHRPSGLTHIIGAGLAGLSAAVRLAERGRKTAVYEAAGQAGGRCRSYYDSGFGAIIDNGNHLLLSGNDAAMRYLALIGAADKLQGPQRAEFAFVEFDNRRALEARHRRRPLAVLAVRPRPPRARH